MWTEIFVHPGTQNQRYYIEKPPWEAMGFIQRLNPRVRCFWTRNRSTLRETTGFERGCREVYCTGRGWMVLEEGDPEPPNVEIRDLNDNPCISLEQYLRKSNVHVYTERKIARLLRDDTAKLDFRRFGF